MGWINEKLFTTEKETENKKLTYFSNRYLQAPYSSRNEAFFSVSICHNENGIERKIEFDFGYKFQKNLIDVSSYSIVKENFLLNAEIPNGVVNEINMQIGTMLYPVNILINKEGSIDSFETSSTLLERWASLRKDLQYTYKGEILQGILDVVDKTINNNTKLHTVYKNDLVTNLMFQSIFGKYDKQSKKQSKIWLAQLGNATNNYAGLQMEVTYQLMPFYHDDEDFVVKVAGELDDNWWITTGSELWTDTENPNKKNGKKMIAAVSGEIWLDKLNRTLLGIAITINQTFGDWEKTTIVEINA